MSLLVCFEIRAVTYLIELCIPVSHIVMLCLKYGCLLHVIVDMVVNFTEI